MKNIDFRNATFASIRQTLNESRMQVYTAWVTYGPATTRELADKSGIDLLTLRPRTTDLCQLGLVELAVDERSTEGVYKAVPEVRWDDWRSNQISGQQQLI